MRRHTIVRSKAIYALTTLGLLLGADIVFTIEQIL